MDMKLFIIACVQAIISLLVLYQIVQLNNSSRENQLNSEKIVLLLTVLANQQGATQADVDKALGK